MNENGQYVIVHGDYVYPTPYKTIEEANSDCERIEKMFFYDAHWSDREEERAQREFDDELVERGY